MNFVEFIQTYGYYIVAGVSLLISVIISLINRKKILIDDSITSKLLNLVIEAESKFGSGHGKEKLDYVLTTYLSKNPRMVEFESLVKGLVELILTSPQSKKGE